MRKKIIAANWKMNMDYDAGLALFSDVINLISAEATGLQQTIICAPFIHLHSLAQMAIGNSKVRIGAQNCHQADSGAYTGEISAGMIRSTGAEYVIIGHSERRKYFGETNALVAEKINTALKNALKPIVCIGEAREERQASRQFDSLRQQLAETMFHLDKVGFERLVIAYEPLWAVGTGLSATPVQAQEMHGFIRKEIAGRYGQEVAQNINILYGGSCQRETATALFAQPDIDGGLIGGSSLDAREFFGIIKVYN